MKAIIPEFDYQSGKPIYLQLYTYIKEAILDGNITASEKLPSLRILSKNLGLSLTTIELAYNQLLVEGYISSKPQSGYYVSQVTAIMGVGSRKQGVKDFDKDELLMNDVTYNNPPYYYDLTSFDFIKWKKCMNKVLTEFPHMLLSESNPKGETALRYEISKYVYLARGVICNPDQIVIGAGTQQILGQLCNILNRMGIKHVAVEDPCYLPVRNIFRDREFAITAVGVGKEGINIARLPSNIRSAVYVSPSNQFPTGYIMPIGKRYKLLDWANSNNSIIIEDDYDSELRYFGKPIPSLQGLDHTERVVYLGSFSSTLFPSIKISYMILPAAMAKIFDTISGDYTQTCSKTEQLTLAIYMGKGLYQTNIKKLRTLYSQKLQAALTALNKYGTGMISTVNSSSGINMLINVKSEKSSGVLCQEARSLGIYALPITTYTDVSTHSSATLIFYYNQIPLHDIENAIKNLISKWENILDK